MRTFSFITLIISLSGIAGGLAYYASTPTLQALLGIVVAALFAGTGIISGLVFALLSRGAR